MIATIEFGCLALIDSHYDTSLFKYAQEPPDADSYENICSDRCHCFTNNRVSFAALVKSIFYRMPLL